MGSLLHSFRKDKWWWEGTVALRKIGISMIGVFGAAMEEMQVSLTLVLVFFIILLTAVMRPYGEHHDGRLLQKLEVSTLCLLYLTLWAASVFSVYPRCEIREGESVWWCDLLSVIIGLADAALIFLVVLIFVWLKGAASCLNRCFGALTELPAAKRVTRQWDLWQGGEAAVQARTRRKTVDAKDNSTSTFVNPLNPMDSGQRARPQEPAPAPPRERQQPSR